MKILILKPSSLGDVIQALPVLRLLKLHFRDAEIFWWIDAALAPLLAGDPDLAGVVRFERKRWARPHRWPEMFRSVRWLRAQNFDLVIDLQCLARSGAFAWLARGKFLVGLDEVREGARGFYDVAVPRKSFHTHAVDWYLSVLPALGLWSSIFRLPGRVGWFYSSGLGPWSIGCRPERDNINYSTGRGVPAHKNFQWLPERPAVAAELKRKWFGENPPSTIQNAQWILLQPGARWENKRWPATHFAELLRALAQKFPAARFAILGGKDDQPLGEVVLQAAPERGVNLCGATSLPEMVEWIRLCHLMVTNDTGPMHVAAALGKPLVALFGPTEPRRTGPYGQLENVLRLDLPCSPCLKSVCHFEKPEACLRTLAPAQVLARIHKMFP